MVNLAHENTGVLVFIYCETTLNNCYLEDAGLC
jgi:hypothetical protein